MTRFFITFGQASPLRDYWIEVLAPSSVEARLFASQYQYWCGCYTEGDWKPEYFPSGRVGAVVVLPKVSDPLATQREACDTAQ